MGEGLRRQAPSSYTLSNGQSFVKLIDTILKQGNLAFLVAQTVKNLPAMQETWVGKIPGEGHGNPLQYSCLENPMDRGAWRATVHGVAKSRTQLRDLTHFYPVVTMKNPRLLGAGIMVNATDFCDQMIKLGKPKRKAFDVEGKGWTQTSQQQESRSEMQTETGSYSGGRGRAPGGTGWPTWSPGEGTCSHRRAGEGGRRHLANTGTEATLS